MRLFRIGFEENIDVCYRSILEENGAIFTFIRFIDALTNLKFSFC